MSDVSLKAFSTGKKRRGQSGEGEMILANIDEKEKIMIEPGSFVIRKKLIFDEMKTDGDSKRQKIDNSELHMVELSVSVGNEHQDLRQPEPSSTRKMKFQASQARCIGTGPLGNQN